MICKWFFAIMKRLITIYWLRAAQWLEYWHVKSDVQSKFPLPFSISSLSQVPCEFLIYNTLFTLHYNPDNLVLMFHPAILCQMNHVWSVDFKKLLTRMMCGGVTLVWDTITAWYQQQYSEIFWKILAGKQGPYSSGQFQACNS